MDRFACIDYDLVCNEGKKADSVCFYIENCKNVKVYIVEKKVTIDLQSSKGMKMFEQIEQTVNNLSSLCRNLKCIKIAVAGKVTQGQIRGLRFQSSGDVLIYSYERISRLSNPSIEELIAKYVYENKK